MTLLSRYKEVVYERKPTTLPSHLQQMQANRDPRNEGLEEQMFVDWLADTNLRSL